MITNQMSFLFIEFNFCPREQRKSNCENHFHMFMLLSTEKLRNSYYYQIIQKKLFNLFFWHFLWLHAFNQVYNSDKTFPIHNEFSSGVPAWAANSNWPIRRPTDFKMTTKSLVGCSRLVYYYCCVTTAL